MKNREQLATDGGGNRFSSGRESSSGVASLILLNKQTR